MLVEMSDVTPVTTELTQRDVPFRTFRHPGPIHSLEQAAEERGETPGQVVRSILFRVNEDEFVMVLMAGPEQIPWKPLRHYLGQSRMTMATEEEVLEITGYRPGSVSPFGLPHPVRVLVDKSVMDQEEISIGSGERGLAVILKTADLLRALGNADIVELGDSLE
jgi:Cys-tRNA(Pro)/Cys-tRNA(Cys) deacylase